MYDGEGNLICEVPEHLHGESCYQEVETLSCGQEEREGHSHTDAYYEKVLVCGKESHIHSTECYKEDSSAVAATDQAAGGASTMTSGGSDTAGSDAMPEEYIEDGTSGMTDTAEEPVVSDPSVPQLDLVDMEAMITKDTGFYYFHAEEDEDIPANNVEITDWKEVKKDTKLASTDLVKVYFAYKIPAGSLNESNSVIRYRLLGNIHLTDEQIEAINHTENCIYASMDQEEAEAQRYLGVEAVEGDRKPDEKLVDGVQEYISAIVKAENIFDDEGRYLGQDLIFTFVPYTIEKNQNTYDPDGSKLTAGEKITGWFACDFNINQIDRVEKETDLDNSTVEKSAEVVFVEEDREIQFTVTNTFSRGALKITKNVTYNKGEMGVFPAGKEPLVDKEFLFAVTKDGTPIDGSPFSITITNGASKSLTIPNLEIGNYVITETDSKGLELTEYSGGVSHDSTTKSVTVTVTAGDIVAAQSSAQASFTNNYAETDIIVKKVDQVKAEANPEDDERFIAGAKFYLLDSDEHAVTGYKVINLKNNQELELEDNKFVVPVEGVKITGLPNGSFVLKEWEAPAGGRS